MSEIEYYSNRRSRGGPHAVYTCLCLVRLVSYGKAATHANC
jgi:hypothetical protein